MKGGLAAMVEALTAIHQAGVRLRGDLEVSALAGESGKAPVAGLLRDFAGPSFEGGGVGAERLLRRGRRPDAVVICGPTDCWVVNAQPGYVMLKIALIGRAAHQSSRGPDSSSLSAIDLAGQLVQALREWEPRYRSAYQLQCGMGTMYPNLTVGAIEGGWPFKPAQAPGACNLYLDLRIPPQLDRQAALSEFEDVVRSTVGPAEGWKYSLQAYADNTPGALTPLAHPLVQAALDARTVVIGEPQTTQPDRDLASGDDGKVFARHGIPNVKIGPGGLPGPGEQRRSHEWVAIRRVVQAARIYVLTALDLANRDRAEVATWPGVKTRPADFAR
jgi:acetylornithine deacetylase/succinyl-diaminopimelate desuccinylase-like protein